MKITFDEAEMYTRLAKIEESLKDLRNLTDDVCYIRRVQELVGDEKDLKTEQEKEKDDEKSRLYWEAKWEAYFSAQATSKSAEEKDLKTEQEKEKAKEFNQNWVAAWQEEDFKVKWHENKMAAWQAECRINDLKKSFEL
jgi:hypothetical protein